MREQGSSTFSVDESGRCLDRLASLESVVTPERIRQALAKTGRGHRLVGSEEPVGWDQRRFVAPAHHDFSTFSDGGPALEASLSHPTVKKAMALKTGRVNERSCLLTHDVMLWVVIAMGCLPACRFVRSSRSVGGGREGEPTPERSSLCEARQRLGVEPVRQLHADIVRPLATADPPGAFYQGLRWMAIDGTVFSQQPVLDVPDSAANAEAFGRPTGGRGDGAFPQVRKVRLIEVGTHAEVALVSGGLHEGEQTLARRLFDQIPADALLTEDRGFFCYEDWKTLISRQIQLLVRVKKSLVLKRVRDLPDGSYIAKIYPTTDARQKDRNGLEVRVIEYTLDDPQRTGHGQTHRLITTLLNPLLYAALDLITGYHERWEIELVFDEQKTHQDPVRAEKPANLRSESPDGVRQELPFL